jgi:DNA mismatch endonuclease (patch repair protein)
MRLVKSKNTKPELAIRRLLVRIGQRGYRLHRGEIAGKPDVVWIKRKLAIFINGCFWHGHRCSHGRRKPMSHRDYWNEKIEGNRRRDERNRRVLNLAGWQVLVVWECQLIDEAAVIEKLKQFLFSV